MAPKSYDVYIYQHVPKCGGRSFIAVCRKHLHKVADSPPSFPTKQQRAEFQKTKKDLSSLPPRTFLHGHLIHRGIRAFERYGKELSEGKCAVVTIIRDPLERVLSEYFHRKKLGLDSGSLREWLARHSNNICGNLGIRMKEGKPVDDFFLMIGTTERLQDSLNVFAYLAGFPTEEIGRVNASPREELDLTEQDIEAFKKANAEDYALYAYATERLDRQVRELPKEALHSAKAVSSDARSRILIYQELPKCGGRSFLRACKKYFKLTADEPPEDEVDAEERNRTKPRLSELPTPALVHGALIRDGIRPSERYREELARGGVGVFTIVRDPLERAVSMFLERVERGKVRPEDLREALGRRKNAMCRMLGVKMRKGKPVDASYLFIGVYEEPSKTFLKLLQCAGITAGILPVFEPVKSGLARVELKPEWVEEFRQNNRQDFALYEYARRTLAGD